MLRDQSGSTDLKLFLQELRFVAAMRHLSLPHGPLKLVCLAAHPDDIEIAAGATLTEPRRTGRCSRPLANVDWLTRAVCRG